MVGDDHLDWDGPEEGQGEHAPDENDPTEYPVCVVTSYCSSNQFIVKYRLWEHLELGPQMIQQMIFTTH